MNQSQTLAQRQSSSKPEMKITDNQKSGDILNEKNAVASAYGQIGKQPGVGNLQNKVKQAMRGTTSVPELIDQASMDYASASDGREGQVDEGDQPIFSINDKQIRHVTTLKRPTVMASNAASQNKLDQKTDMITSSSMTPLEEGMDSGQKSNNQLPSSILPTYHQSSEYALQNNRGTVAGLAASKHQSETRQDNDTVLLHNHLA